MKIYLNELGHLTKMAAMPISSPWRKKSITPKFPKITFFHNLILNNDIHVM